jgi:hypothetical protein
MLTRWIDTVPRRSVKLPFAKSYSRIERPTVEYPKVGRLSKRPVASAAESVTDYFTSCTQRTPVFCKPVSGEVFMRALGR